MAATTFHFCWAGCRTKFVADPEPISAASTARAEAPAGTIYTCPMHPDIRQIGPGSCPICGMALEPEIAAVRARSGAADMTRRFWIGLVLTLPVVFLAMGGHLVRDHGWADPTLEPAAARLATPVVLWAGWPFFERGWQSLVTAISTCSR